MPETTPLIKAALNLRVGAGFDVYLLSLEEMGESVKEGSLYVIGNGFDMLHGVRSSYYDFSKTLGKRSSVRFYLEKYLKTNPDMKPID